MNLLLALLLMQTSGTPHSKIELIAENTAIAPGESLRIGVRVTIHDGWHIYWKNPGDSGIPTQIKWNLPAGWKVSDMKWPTPQAIELDGMTSFGYENSVLFMTRIVAPTNATIGASIPVSADVDFLICKESCLPGNAAPKMTLQVGQPALIRPSAWASIFEKTALETPQSTVNWGITASRTENGVLVQGNAPAYIEFPKQVRFFGAKAGEFENNVVSDLTTSGREFKFLVPVSTYSSSPPTKIAGVVTGFGTQSYDFNVPIAN